VANNANQPEAVKQLNCPFVRCVPACYPHSEIYRKACPGTIPIPSHRGV